MGFAIMVWIVVALVPHSSTDLCRKVGSTIAEISEIVSSMVFEIEIKRNFEKIFIYIFRKNIQNFPITFYIFSFLMMVCGIHAGHVASRNAWTLAWSLLLKEKRPRITLKRVCNLKQLHFRI
jgi:hypothetical protein